jgi:hypothetical protein
MKSRFFSLIAAWLLPFALFMLLSLREHDWRLGVAIALAFAALVAFFVVVDKVWPLSILTLVGLSLTFWFMWDTHPAKPATAWAAFILYSVQALVLFFGPIFLYEDGDETEANLD